MEENKSNTNFLLDKNDLVRYMAFLHKKQFGTDISRIKLQKGLYFLYAFWIKTKSESNSSENEISDLVRNLSDRLFDFNMEAWSYGPVDYEIYRQQKENKIVPFSEEEAFSYSQYLNDKSEFIDDYINSMIQRIFNTSDFGLVELSHRDTAWKKNYNPQQFLCNEKITHDDVKEDYEFKIK